VIQLGMTKARGTEMLINYTDTSYPFAITAFALAGERQAFAYWRIWENIGTCPLVYDCYSLNIIYSVNSLCYNKLIKKPMGSQCNYNCGTSIVMETVSVPKRYNEQLSYLSAFSL